MINVIISSKNISDKSNRNKCHAVMNLAVRTWCKDAMVKHQRRRQGLSNLKLSFCSNHFSLREHLMKIKLYMLQGKLQVLS